MTVLDSPPEEITVVPEAPTKASNDLARRVGSWVVAYFGALAVFAAFMAVKGVNPLVAYRDMFDSTLMNSASLSEVLIKAAPFLLAALAVAVPARGGLVNLGGEGQIVMGGVAAAGIALGLEGNVASGLVMVAMLIGAMAAGALWAALAGVLRVGAGINEAISTLLLNYIAIDVLLYLISGPWKDSAGFGQLASKPLADETRLPTFGSDGRIHLGVFIAMAAAVGIWLLLRSTSWGFQLRVAGGNGEAARRAGLPVAKLLLSGLIAGGAMAGLAGAVHFAGVEGQLRPGMTFGFGYIGFLASWLAGHHPIRIAGAALLLGAIAVAGDSLQIDAGLPAASVNVLMAFVLFAVLGKKPRLAGASR